MFFSNRSLILLVAALACCATDVTSLQRGANRLSIQERRKLQMEEDGGMVGMTAAPTISVPPTAGESHAEQIQTNARGAIIVIRYLRNGIGTEQDPGRSAPNRNLTSRIFCVV